MKTRWAIASLILITPGLLVLFWHVRNHGLPNDDAADFAQTALRISNEFKRGPLIGTLAEFYIRGWRPIAFPALATPFLVVTGRNVVAGCAITLVLIHLALTVYLYRLSRLLSADCLAAAVVCSFVLSMPAILTYSLLFFSESAWLLCTVACAYHLFRGGLFRDVRQGLCAGLFAGLMLDIRPVESSVVLAVLLSVLAGRAIRSGEASIKSTLAVLGPCILPGLLLVVSSRIQGVTGFYVLVACFAALTLEIPLARRHNRSFVAFLGVLTSTVCVWWAGFMPNLFAWVYEASFGRLAQITDRRFKEQTASGFVHLAQSYGPIQMAFVAGLVIWLAATALLAAFRTAPKVSSEGALVAGPRLLAFVSATMLAAFGTLYAITGTGDPRRIFVALVLFITAVGVIAVMRSRAVLAAVSLIAVGQFTLVGSIAAGAPLPGVLQGLGGVPAPHSKPDGNLAVARILAQYVSRGDIVAVYTLTLFQAHARVYEPAALNLASLQEDYGFNVGYVYDSTVHEEVLTRLRQSHCRYLLLDSYAQTSPESSRLPYVQFVSELLRLTKAGTIDSPGLQRIARFQLGNREHTLFQLLP